MKRFQTIATERLILRAMRPSDAGPMTLYAGDNRVSNMTTSVPHPYVQQMAETFIEQSQTGAHRDDVWVLDASNHGGAEFIGLILLEKDSHEISFWVGPPFWSTGYASEALAGVISHLFNDRKLPEITASVFFDNQASQKVLRRAGFTETGHTWRHSVSRGVEVPSITFRLVAAERNAIPSPGLGEG